jgi:hypothetical protein
MIAHIYQEVDGGKKVSTKLPFLLRDKLSFLQKAYAEIPRLKKQRKVVSPLLSAVKRHNNRIRVPIIHGYLSRYNARTKALTFVKIDGGGDTAHSVSQITGTAADITKAVVSLSALSVEVASAMETLAAIS